jgi:hypothetical protein
MATSERVFHPQHLLHQSFHMSFVCRIAVTIAVTLSTEPRS